MLNNAANRAQGIKALHLVVLLLFFLAIAGLITGFIFTNDARFALVGLAVAAFVITLIPSLINKRVDYDPFQPVNFVALTTLFGVTLHTIYIVVVNNYTTRAFLMLGRDPIFLSRALITILLALACWLLGYFMRAPNLKLQNWLIIRRSQWNLHRLLIAIWVLMIISGVCIILYMRTLDLDLQSLTSKLSGKRRLVIEGADYKFASLGYYLWGASLTSYAFYILTAAVAHLRLSLRSPLGLTMILCGLLSCVLPFITSSRAEILYNLLLATMIWHYIRYRLTLKAMLVTALIGILVYSSLGSLRIAGGQLTEDAFRFDPEKLASSLFGTRHWLGVSKTAHIMAAVPERLEYQKGKTMIGWLVAPIPRTLWKEKPIIRTGQLLGPKVFFAERNVTGSPPGFVAELYLNFGLPAIFIGMFFLGYFVKLLYQNFYPFFQTHINALLIYLMVILRFSLDLLAGDFNGVMINMLQALITIIIILGFIGGGIKPIKLVTSTRWRECERIN